MDSASALLQQRARLSGDAFRSSPYFDEAEGAMHWQWDAMVRPFIDQHPIDGRRALDLAAGHGRNSARLVEFCDHVVVVDINEVCIDACRTRFAGDERFSYVCNDGSSLAGVESGSITFLYCFDAMVHFHPDVVRAYLPEFRRVLAPGAFGFVHHSNFSGNPGGEFKDNPHWRNNMTAELFARGCRDENLEIVEQKVLDWGSRPEEAALDCFSMIRRPL